MTPPAHGGGRPEAGACKVLPLDQAVAQAARPGMTLHFAYTHNRPVAAMAQLLRQFCGQDPRFTLAHMFTTGAAVALLSEGLVAHLITTLICEPYPAPAPSAPARRALAPAGSCTVEHWSVLSYIARLQAAALGLPWLPVRSLIGSTLVQENRAHVTPRPEHGTVEVAALRPDLSFVHAPCADRHGNVLLAPPLGEGIFGALAARDGVVVTAERLVEPDIIRRHSHLPGIPASRVLSVSEVPLGAHPCGLAAGGIEGVEPYGDDDDFYAAGRRAGATPDGWKEWVQRWVAGPADHDDYLARVGPRRLLELKGKARPDSWHPELIDARARLPLAAPATPSERMICCAARLIARRVRAAGLRAVLSGFGAGNLAAWLAHAELAGSGAAPELVAEVGLFGYTPRPCDPFLFNFRNLATCSLRGDAATSLGLFVGGRGARCLGSLGAGQVDGCGNFNSTRLADGALLVGSGGANDVASLADEVVITLPASRARLPRSLPYITGPGERVTAVVTDLGVFEKERGHGPLRLTRLPGPLAGGEARRHVEELRGHVEFPFEVAPGLKIDPLPGPGSLERLRLFDPERAFLGRLDPADV